MFSVELKCPHCFKEGAFTIHGPTEYVARQPAEVKNHPHANLPTASVTAPRTGTSRVKAFGVACCPRCNSPVLVWFEGISGQLLGIRQASQSLEWRWNGEEPKIIAVYPELARPDDSPHYPQALRQVFVELQEDIQDKRTPARIVSGCRSVMEVALRSLGYDKPKESLSDRIDKARADGLITESIRKWAHHVRLEGNFAIHELGETTDAEAQELVDFLRLFLEVAFDLPARVPAQKP